ncbi:hypothetical protein NX059_006440 [Plenodomus lindquistii]|nr:hypothetical protein NX059_006440 [Plenodomus lindquistii]
MADTQPDHEDEQSLIQTATDTLLLPVRIATSPVLLRTYLRTIFLFITSTVFFGFAVVAYSSFYYSYIPIRGITVPVYLQYDHGTASSVAGCLTSATESGSASLGGKSVKWPYGLANVPGLVDRQKYDVVVEMDVPRSDNNLNIGNWMVGLEMRGPTTIGSGVLGLLGWDEEWDVQDHSLGGRPGSTTPPASSSDKAVVLARSKRPAILTYRSRVIEMAHRFLRLPFYLVGWHTESEHVEISMMESVMFEQGYRNVPTSIRLELRSRQPLEVYRVKVRISARLEGLRWLMYKYWLTTALVGIILFWSVEMGVLVFTWGMFTLLFRSSSTTPVSSTPNENQQQVKTEPKEHGKVKKGPTEDVQGNLSDTSRTFPTLPSQQPLSYYSPKEEPQTPKLGDIPTKEDLEADDEDDDFVLEDALPPRKKEGSFEDSGLGTSLESSIERGLSRRRSGKNRGLGSENERG